MSKFRRLRQPGGTYFFTARLLDRGSDLLLREVAPLRAAFRATKNRYPFEIDAIVILPAAIHTVWTLPPGDADFSTRWAMLKGLFSKGLPFPPQRSPTQIKRGEKGLWQRRFWEHLIQDEADLAAHINYIHQAPVQAGLVSHASTWQHSSIHRNTRGVPLTALPGCPTYAPQVQLTG